MDLTSDRRNLRAALGPQRLTELDVAHPGAMKKRSVVTLVDDDHHRMEMYFDTGEGEIKSMEIDYERA